MNLTRVTIRGSGADDADGILFQPESGSRGSRAALITHRWGGDFDDPLPVSLGTALAERGVTSLSYRLRRYGTDGQRAVTPDDDVADLRRAITWLGGQGYRDLFLAGEGVGAVSLGLTQIRHADPTVKGLACIRPAHPMGESLTRMIGRDAYEQARTAAEAAVARGAGQEQLIEVLREGRPDIRQLADPWLRWWGGSADTDLGEILRVISVPVLICGADEPWAETLQSKAPASIVLTIDLERDNPAVIARVTAWLDELSPAADT